MHASLIRSQKGLTLVEILVVLIILGVLMTLLGSRIFGAKDRALADASKITIKSIQQNIEEFRLRYNSLPGGLEDLVRCSEKTGQGCIPLAKEEDLRDAWGTPLVYRLDGNGRAYQIKSLGADSRDGGSGADSDITITGP